MNSFLTQETSPHHLPSLRLTPQVNAHARNNSYRVVLWETCVPYFILQKII